MRQDERKCRMEEEQKECFGYPMEQDELFIRLSKAHYPNLVAEVMEKRLVSVCSLANFAHVTPEMIEKIIWNPDVDFRESESYSLSRILCKYGLTAEYLFQNRVSFYNLQKRQNSEMFYRLLKQFFSSIRYYKKMKDNGCELSADLHCSALRAFVGRLPSEIQSSGYMLKAEYNAMTEFVRTIDVIKKNPVPKKPRSE